jgi:PadR family transcriptional regulator, regulatory protein PadR
MSSPLSPTGSNQTLDRDAARFGRNAEPFILLILQQGRSYGYEIRGRLAQFGFRRAERDPGVVYRLLRNLEEAGLIDSEWEAAGAGPARHYYRLTATGRDQLRRGAEHLERHARRLAQFFELYRSPDAPDRED